MKKYCLNNKAVQTLVDIKNAILVMGTVGFVVVSLIFALTYAFTPDNEITLMSQQLGLFFLITYGVLVTYFTLRWFTANIEEC